MVTQNTPVCRHAWTGVCVPHTRPRALYIVPQVYLITELLTGGELLEAVLKRGSYTEDEARLCWVQVLRGIEYLHSK